MNELAQNIFYRLSTYTVWNDLDSQVKDLLMEAINIGVDETPKQVSQNFCEWLEVKEADGIMYETDCENGFICGDYERLYKDYKYCPYCGKPIKIKRGKQ